MDIGTILIKLRSIKGYSQEAVANEIGVNYKTYARYESGKNEMKVNALVSIASFYKMTVDELLNYDPNNPETKKRRSYEEMIQDRDHKIQLMEQELMYTKKELKYVHKINSLLEGSNVDHSGGSISASLGERRAG